MAKKQKKNSGLMAALITVDVLLILGILGMIYLCVTMPNISGILFPGKPGVSAGETVPATVPDTTGETEQTEPPTTEETEPPTTAPEAEHVVSTATIGATGDILMHLPVVNAGLHNGTYNFDFIFKYLKEYSEGVDYAIANLETTLCGTDNGYPYHGYPNFNCPDEIVDAAKDAGFDMLLTANNHCYDTGKVGYLRTLEVVRGKGLDTLGTMTDPEDAKYAIKEINGINIGLLCYTYETGVPQGGYSGRIYLNGLPMDKGGEEIINSFLPSNLDPFYEEIGGYMAEMREQGAEAIVVFLHWGEEYVRSTIPYQKTMAQKLCDMGVDVIVGGHPHVVEPVELLTSTEDPEHRTVCLYSMGNAVSNQRLGNLSSVSTAHTEDGVWFTMTFSKYSDGTVYLENVDLMPLWVDLRTNNGREYDIIPLDESRTEEWQEAFELSDSGAGAAQRSYDRTIAIVGEGLAESQEYLAAQKAEREAGYQAVVDEWYREHGK